MTDDDWRLTGQEAYLTGVALCWREYRRYSETWDHDHCEFCWSKFAEPSVNPEALHAGYATLDEYRWVCNQCFGDFRQRFGWTIAECGT
ncbi:hypothetical protein [Rubrivirga sp. IMCC45206]|uniref:hypothetical protein n=1 Tax=Rubrivirga sp. IMCC45206 TaxID=3391614 RepID=UPI0039901B74